MTALSMAASPWTRQYWLSVTPADKSELAQFGVGVNTRWPRLLDWTVFTISYLVILF